MATRTKPFMTAAALVSAAAVAVATPALAPSIASSTSPALSAAKVNLANFSDVLSIPASEWNNVFYTGWGYAIQPIEIDPDTNVNDYWLPNCNSDCYIPGVSGVAYLALDALINGTGTGFDNYTEWGTSAVNYYFEGNGIVTALQYVLEKPFLGEPYTTPGPLYNPAVANLIELAFQGGYALTTLYVTALSTLAQAAQAVPYIGQYLYRGIASYVGLAFQTIDSTYDYNVYAGIPGVLRYIGGVITTGGNSNPYPLVQEPAPASVAAKAPAAVTAASVAASTQTATETATEVVSNTPAVSVADTKAAVASTESASNESASSTASDATETSTTSAADAVAESVATAAPTSKPADSSVKTRKRPVRDAVAKAAKSVASAVSGAASGAAGADASAGAAG